MVPGRATQGASETAPEPRCACSRVQARPLSGSPPFQCARGARPGAPGPRPDRGAERAVRIEVGRRKPVTFRGVGSRLVSLGGAAEGPEPGVVARVRGARRPRYVRP